MAWHLAGAAEAAERWVDAEPDVDSDLRAHVLSWLQRLEQVGPERIEGARYDFDGNVHSRMVQSTRVIVRFAVEGDTILVMDITHKRVDSPPPPLTI